VTVAIICDRTERRAPRRGSSLVKRKCGIFSARVSLQFSRLTRLSNPTAVRRRVRFFSGTPGGNFSLKVFPFIPRSEPLPPLDLITFPPTEFPPLFQFAVHLPDRLGDLLPGAKHEFPPVSTLVPGSIWWIVFGSDHLTLTHGGFAIGLPISPLFPILLFEEIFRPPRDKTFCS